MKNLFEAGRAHRIWFYAVLALAVIASLMMVPVKWDGLREIQMMPLPPLPEMMRNAALALSGHENGYSRAAQGYGIFLLMAGAFLSSGKFILSLILRGPGESILDRLTGRERFAFYFMTGSLAYSLLWFGLGLTGILGRSSSYAVVLIGWIPALIHLRRGLPDFPRFKKMEPAEAAFLAVTAGALVLLSTNAAFYPMNPDTLASHGGLPVYYIQQGRVTINPYHIYSYLTQNTEMLIMGSLLMGSEFAAQMMVWGFVAAWMLLIWGFLERYAGSLASIATVAVVLAIPTVTRSAFEFKNDSSASLFIFAHYVCLIEALRADAEPKGAVRKWFLLAGLFAGGAISHKMLGVPVALFSFLLLAGDAALRKRKKLPLRGFALPFVIAVMIPVLPWFIRTYIETSNPMYPFFEKMYPPRTPFGWKMTGLYLNDLLFGSNVSYPNIADSMANTNSYRPTWGASLLFVLLIVPSLFIPAFRGFRLCWAAALLSFLLLVYRSLVMRYHMGPLVFLAATLFALGWREVLDYSKSEAGRRIVIGALALTILVSNIWLNTQPALTFLMSGYAPGNNLGSRRGVDDLYWMGHLINTRTPPDDTVLFAGVLDTFPFKRKTLATGPMNPKKMLAVLSEESRDAGELQTKLRDLSVDHIVVSSAFYQKSHLPVAQISDEAMERIEELLKRRMRVKYASPDRSLVWYAFEEGEKIVFSAADAEMFPWPYINEVRRLRAEGSAAEARRMLDAARSAPMAETHRKEVERMLEEMKSRDLPRALPADQRF